MDLKRISEVLKAFAKEKGYQIYDISYHKKDQTLSVLFDEQLSLDEIEERSALISAFLDDYEEEFPDQYLLDVSTAGAERAIRDEDELKQALGGYIFVKDKEKNEYTGTLKSYDEGIMVLEVMDKNRTREVTVPYANVRKVRYAVKF